MACLCPSRTTDKTIVRRVFPWKISLKQIPLRLEFIKADPTEPTKPVSFLQIHNSIILKKTWLVLMHLGRLSNLTFYLCTFVCSLYPRLLLHVNQVSTVGNSLRNIQTEHRHMYLIYYYILPPLYYIICSVLYYLNCVTHFKMYSCLPKTN